MYRKLFSEIEVGGIRLKNRLIMAPLYLGYAAEGGAVSRMLLEHYRLMAGSGVAMVVVENAAVDYPGGSGSTRTLRVDADDYLDGLGQLSETIRKEGALSCLQINHAGRFAGAAPEPVAPSAVAAFGRTPRPLDEAGIERIRRQYVDAAVRAKRAGFDMVELHGGTGYLLSEFLSPRTNLRTDAYGGSPEARGRFPLEVVGAVKAAVGNFPAGYRFLADEWLPNGLTPEESAPFAERLSAAGIAYISVMGGTYESFVLPDIVEKSKNPGYMLGLAAAVKKHATVPVAAAGRLSTGRIAEEAIADGKADLIGLARVLWADPAWPEKVRSGRESEIIRCGTKCSDACTQMVMKGLPALCVSWPAEKMKEWKAKFA